MVRYTEKANPIKFCFICGKPLPGENDTPDQEAPFRCQACFSAVAQNEADGEL